MTLPARAAPGRPAKGSGCSGRRGERRLNEHQLPDLLGSGARRFVVDTSAVELPTRRTGPPTRPTRALISRACCIKRMHTHHSPGPCRRSPHVACYVGASNGHVRAFGVFKNPPGRQAPLVLLLDDQLERSDVLSPVRISTGGFTAPSSLHETAGPEASRQLPLRLQRDHDRCHAFGPDPVGAGQPPRREAKLRH
jgi:hypothetical protein